MKIILNLLLGILISISVAGHAADDDQVRADELLDLPKPQLQSPGDLIPPKTKLQPITQPTQIKQRSIGETEKNLIARPTW